jgi:homogentisate 1,2-dioxygenase
MSKNWISFPLVEGRASRQAHADLPEGTYEREIGREGFFGPATHMYHSHMPTAWTSFEGPLRPHAYDTNRLADGVTSPLALEPLLANANARIRVWHVDHAMQAREISIATSGGCLSGTETMSCCRAARCGAWNPRANARSC